MNKILEYSKKNASFLLISVFWLFALLNPAFRKYDYGAGYPLVILFGGLVFVLAVLEFKKKRENDWLEQFFLMLFLAMMIISYLHSGTKTFGFSEVLAFSSAIPLYLLFSSQKPEWTDKFLKVVIGGTLASVLIGYFFYCFGLEARMFGPFYNIFHYSNKWPNAFAMFLLMTWPLFLLFQKNKDSKWYSVIGLGLVISALFLTFSRGALIAFWGQLLLLAIFYFRQISWKKIGLTLLTGVIAVSLFASATYLRSMEHETVNLQERATFGNDQSLTSKQERLDFWIGSIELIKEKPLLGWGPFSFRYAYNPMQKIFLGNSDHPHNIFLKIGLENGLIALGFLLIFIALLVAKVIRAFPGLSKEKKDTVALLSIAVLGTTAHNLIDYNLNFISTLMLFFLYLALISSLTVKGALKVRKAMFPLLMGILIIFICFYESVIFVNEKLGKDYGNFSLYSRFYFMNQALEEYDNGDFASANKYLDTQQKLSPLDPESYYLRGVIDFEEGNYAGFKENLQKAIELNPLNSFKYYDSYVWGLQSTEQNGIQSTPEDMEIVNTALQLIIDYFDYVDNNVHFTAFTDNVEYAVHLIYGLEYFVGTDTAEKLKQKADEMVKEAKRVRDEKAVTYF